MLIRSLTKEHSAPTRRSKASKPKRVADSGGGRSLHYFMESQKVGRDFQLGDILKGHRSPAGMKVTGILITNDSDASPPASSPEYSPRKVKDRSEKIKRETRCFSALQATSIPADRRMRTTQSLRVADHT